MNKLFKSNMFNIIGVPGTIQFSLSEIFPILSGLYFNNLSDNIDIVFDIKHEYKTLIGCSCRQLFNNFILTWKHINKDKIINIGVSPILHTSFRDIIEKNFNKSQIHLFDFDNSYNKLIVPNYIKNIKLDLIIITHLWGKYLDISDIKTCFSNTFIIEDCVLSGQYKNNNSNSDILFYSCGMDKRPSSLFGGYAHIKNKHMKIIKIMEFNILNSKKNKISDSLKKIFDCLILYFIYNSKIIQTVIMFFIFIKNLSLNNVVEKIRKDKPGFNHSYKIKKVDKFIVDINYNKIKNNVSNEKLLIYKHKLFMSYFDKSNIKQFFPWFSNSPNKTICCLPYCPIFIKTNKKLFVKYMNKNFICSAKNPTYKTFDNRNIKIDDFLNNIYFLPSLYNLTDDEVNKLAHFINNFINVTKS